MSVAASPGEGKRGSTKVAAPIKNGQEATRAGAAPGSSVDREVRGGKGTKYGMSKGVQDNAPTALEKPAAQVWHMDAAVAPCVLLKVPAEQLVHDDAPAAL